MNIWISGASQGIGAALSLAYAQQGATVFASARSHDKLAALSHQAQPLSGNIVPLPLDITEAAPLHDTLNEVLADRVLDKAILNAGTYIQQDARQFKADDFAQLVNLNLTGTAHCLEWLIPKLCQQGYGQLALTGSLAGYRGLPNASGYGACKAALNNLAESLRLDLTAHGVDVRIINPGFVNTPLTDRNRFPMPDLISAEDAAIAIIKGLKRSGFEIRFPRRFATVMGMLRHLPASLYCPLVTYLTRSRHEH